MEYQTVVRAEAAEAKIAASVTNTADKNINTRTIRSQEDNTSYSSQVAPVEISTGDATFL